MYHKEVFMNTCIILEGVNGHGVKCMLNTFKEDYNMGDRFHRFSLKVYALDFKKHLVVFEGGFKFADFYDLLLTLFLDLNDGQDVYGYSCTSELNGVDAEYGLFRFMEVEGELSCIICDESGKNYRETINPKKKLVYDYECAGGLCSYIYQSEYQGSLFMECEISGPKLSEKYSCLFTLLKLVLGFAIAIPVISFGFKADISRNSLFILLGISFLCGITYGTIYSFRNPDINTQKIKNRVGITFMTISVGSLVIIRIIQLISDYGIF